jgi:hypothetical protein
MTQPTNKSNSERITISLTRENLETIGMSLSFMKSCLDSESESSHLLYRITNVLTIIDNKLHEPDRE